MDADEATGYEYEEMTDTGVVVRGGSFADGPTCIRAAHRHHDVLPDDHMASVGFRCAGQAGE